ARGFQPRSCIRLKPPSMRSASRAASPQSNIVSIIARRCTRWAAGPLMSAAVRWNRNATRLPRMLCSLRHTKPNGAEVQMRLGVALPIVDIGGEPAALREFAQAAEEIGYHGIAAPDHVL